MNKNINGIRERRSISLFSDKKPKKETIDKILEESIKYYPKKCSMLYHKVKIFGPEFHEDKRKLVVQTMCDPLYNAADTDCPEKISYLTKLWKDWIKMYRDNKTLKQDITSKFGPYEFNPEILAPYVLIFYNNEEKIDKKKKVNNEEKIHLDSTQSRERALQSSAMHGVITACIAAEYKISSSFLSNISIGTKFNKNAISDSLDLKKQVVLILCLGYPDEKTKWNPKPRQHYDVNQLIEWQ